MYIEALQEVLTKDVLHYVRFLDFSEYRSKHHNSKWKRVVRPWFQMRNNLGFFIRPKEKFLEFAEKKFSSVFKRYMHSLIKNSIKIACKNLNKKLHKIFLHFSFFLIIPMVWKYIQGMGFHLIITVFDFFTPTHWFSIFEKKFHFQLKMPNCQRFQIIPNRRI